MAAPPWMPLYVADYLADTRHLSAAEHGAYLLLLMHQWQHGGIPDDPRKLARIACCLPHQFAKIWPQLRSFFGSQDGGLLVNKRLLAEMRKADEISNVRRAAALQMHSRRRRPAAPLQGSLQDDLHTHPHPHPHPHPQDSVGAHAPTSHGRAPPPGDPGPAPESAADDWPADYRREFAAAYPHKVGLKAALDALDRARGTVPWRVLIEAVHVYAATKPPERQWANPKTWIIEERWNDRPAPPPAPRDTARTRPGLADVAASLIAEARERDRSAGDDVGAGDDGGGDPARDADAR